MFTEILKEKRLQDIIEIFDRDFEVGSIESNVETEIESIIEEIYSKNNEFVDEIVRDRTLLKLKKTRDLRNRAQDGHVQLVNFKNWIITDFTNSIDRNKYPHINVNKFIDPSLLEVINNFEEYVLKRKDRETAILSTKSASISLVISILSFFTAVAAIGISIYGVFF